MIEYESLNIPVFQKIPPSAKYILDVGCGTGSLGKELKKQDAKKIIYGITYSNTESEKASKFLDKVFVEDINMFTPIFDAKFDVIIFSHILEHTYQPEEILKKLYVFLNKNGLIIIALPNVLYYKQRLQFLKGRFKYCAYGGLMDITHYRFFDWQTAQDMINNVGLKIISKEATGVFPLYILRKIMPSACKKLDKEFVKLFPGLFGFQFLFVVK